MSTSRSVPYIVFRLFPELLGGAQHRRARGRRRHPTLGHSPFRDRTDMLQNLGRKNLSAMFEKTVVIGLVVLGTVQKTTISSPTSFFGS